MIVLILESPCSEKNIAQKNAVFRTKQVHIIALVAQATLVK